MENRNSVDGLRRVNLEMGAPLSLVSILLEREREVLNQDPNLAAYPMVYDLAVKAVAGGQYANSDQAILALARELRPRLVALADAVGMGKGGPLSLALGDVWDAREADWRTRSSVFNDMKESALCAAAGVDAPDGELLELDRLGAVHLEGIGPAGRGQAAKLRAWSMENWQKWQVYKAADPKAHDWLSAFRIGLAFRTDPELPDLLAAWRDDFKGDDPATLQNDPAPCFKALAKAVWLDHVKPRLEGTEKGLVVDSWRDPSGDLYAKVDKPVSAMSWVIGGDALGLETIDGDRYTAAPAEVRVVYWPRSYRLLVEGRNAKPSQGTIPFIEPDNEPVTVALSSLTVERMLLPPIGGKLAVLALVGPKLLVPVRELTEAVQPGLSRYQKRDDEKTIEALAALDRLWVYVPGDGSFRAFDVHLPETHEGLAGMAKGRWFEDLLARPAHSDPLRGWFVLNLSGFLRLDNRQPQLQRYYLRLAAAWNEARDAKGFHIDRLPPLNLEAFAALSNALSPGAVAYQDTHNNSASGKTSKSRDLRAVKNDLEALEADDLLVLEKIGRNVYQAKPPQALEEAHEAFRDGQARKNLLHKPC